jgi:hypothetical protein
VNDVLRIYQCQLGDSKRGYLTVSYFTSEEDEEFESDEGFAGWLTEYIKELDKEGRLHYLNEVDKDPVSAALSLRAMLDEDEWPVDVQLQMPRIELIDLDSHND